MVGGDLAAEEHHGRSGFAGDRQQRVHPGSLPRRIARGEETAPGERELLRAVGDESALEVVVARRFLRR